MQFMKMIPGLIQNWSAQCRRLLPHRPVLSRRGLSLALLLSLAGTGCVFLVGCQSPYDAYDAGMATSETDYRAGMADYSTNRLQEGDVVSIMFRYSTNFDTVQKIGLDGNLNLDVAGQIKAVNKTVLQLQDELTPLYQSQAKDDPITVKVISPEAAVYVAGVVTRPGKIPMERPMTVVEAIMEAGGFDPQLANLAGVSVLRVENGRERIYRLNLKRVFDGKDDTVFYLKPFDVVRVPAKTFNY
jgi:polysaccharide export outer membrane protein